VAVEGAGVEAIVETEGDRGTDALRRRCRRRLDEDARARLLLLRVEADRLRLLDDVDGALGVAARRRRRRLARLRDRDAFRRLGCIGFFPWRALDAEAARFFALRSA